MQLMTSASVGAGYNVCIFAYGQTGSGKTHTMAGSNVEDYDGRGINYRALDDLFAINEQRQGEVSGLLHAGAESQHCMLFVPPLSEAQDQHSGNLRI